MNNLQNILLTVLIFSISFSVFYWAPNFITELDKIYITIMIFLFATLTGFFISRQGNRYTKIINLLTSFDGNLSFQYRNMETIGIRYQEKLGQIIKKHFDILSKENQWDWFLTHKVTTLTDINKLHMKIIEDGVDLNKLQSHFINRSQASLLDMHKIRKNLIALANEKIPLLQWIILIFLAIGLFITILSISSTGMFFESILKSFFITSVITVIIILNKLNDLNFYGKIPGQSSAQDVLDIINEKK